MTTNTSGAKGSTRALSSALTALYERRWLLGYLVRRQLSQKYQSSFLGFLWLFLNPLLMIALYTAVFSEIIGIRFRADGGPINFGLYLYCGLIPFTMFSDTLNQSVTSIKSNASLVQKVVFPLEILPLVTAITNFVGKLLGLGVLVVVVALMEGQVHGTLLLLPLIMVPQMMFILGLAYLMAVFGTYVPDIKESLKAVVRAMLFVTPIIWPADRIPERLSFLVDYNPLAYLVEAYRDLVLKGQLPDGTQTLWFSLLAGALLVTGFALFVRVKRQFADLI